MKKSISIIIEEFVKRFNGRVARFWRDFRIKKERKKLIIKDISIISQNCIGGVFYHDMELQFLSPTINLFFYEPDFVRFVLNLEYYLNLELEVHWGEKYPVGQLGDIEIHFMHYATCKEAKEAWDKRKERINYDKILVLATDRNGFDNEVYKQWEKITYPKVLFTAQNQFSEKSEVIYYSEYNENGFVPDLIPERKFYRNNILMDTVNSMK